MLGKYNVYSFDNPYLDAEEGENRYSAAVIMDEARERWRTGNWRAKRESFQLSRKEIAGRKEKNPSRPSSSRFRLDINKDLMGDTISLRKLSELSYSPTYRPQGNLDEHLVTPMSTMQRYDVLAGDLESPPEDISFLTDADDRLRRELQKSGNKKDGSLRRNTVRLEKSLDERRAALIDMLPDADTAEARQIVRESQRRKQRMDAEIGRLPKDPDEEKQDKKKKRRNIYAVPSARSEEPLPELRDLSVVRSQRMPRQYGMSGEGAELPEFQSETRHWSRITSDNPSWSEIQQHTENISPSDLEDEPETRRAHYVDDVEFDPERPFRPIYGTEPRDRLYSDEVGQYENEYNKQNGISPDRIREIMEKEYRGRWIPPEYYSDDRLVNAWFNDLNRGVLDGEDFLDWAYRRRMEAANARRAEEQRRRDMEQRRREQEAMRARRNRSAPPSRPSRHEDERSRYSRAKEMGYRQGQELAQQEQEQKQKQKPKQKQPLAQEQDNDYIRRPSRDSDSGRSRSRSRGGYQGMYPDLFDADERRSAPRHDRWLDDDYDDRYDDLYDDDRYDSYEYRRRSRYYDD